MYVEQEGFMRRYDDTNLIWHWISVVTEPDRKTSVFN